MLAAVIAIAVYVPLAPQPLEQEPDLSFRATTHDAFARRMQIGTDIVTTYGAWGILQRGYDRRTDAAVLAASFLLAAAFAWAVVWIVLDTGGSIAAGVFGAATASCLIVSGGHDARFTVLALLLILSSIAPVSRGRELPLVAAMGIAAHVKFPLLLICVFAVCITAVIRRRVEYVLVFVAAYFIAFFAAGQRLVTLPHFLSRGIELAGGYSEVQSTGSGFPLAIVGAAAFAIYIAVIERDLLRTIALGGAIAYVVKIGYVRADLVHASVANALLLFLIVGYLFIRRNKTERLRVGMASAVAIASIVAMLAGGAMVIDRLRETASAIGDRSRVTQRLESEMVTRSGAATLPRLRESVDAYPWGSSALIAAGLRYSPRPVFESYLAWTRALAELNADHLRGPAAPAWLWVGVGSIDERLPLLDDAPSWLEMLSRYELVNENPEHLLLRRRATRRPVAVRPLRTITARFGERLTINDQTVLWASVIARRTLSSRLRSLLGRPQPLWLEITSAGGERSGWRVSTDLLEGGFLLSPHVSTTADLRRLLSGDVTNRVTSIRLLGEGFGETYTLRLSEVGRSAAHAMRIEYTGISGMR